MPKNNKCILAYGLSEEEVKKIESQNIKVIQINNDMALMTLENMINEDNGEEFRDELPKDEKVVIFYGFKDEQLKYTIRYIRGFVQGGILAVCTPQNYKWTFKYLLEHLFEEREWYKTQQKERK